MFHGETLDSIANGISWVAIVIAPIIGIVIFWLVHILPEKIAHKKKHPQTRAIQCLCLLSSVLGNAVAACMALGYSKPVLHKLAYGTDVDESLGHHGEAETEETSEVERLPRARRATRKANHRRAVVMELILLIIYSTIVWFIFFKKKWLPWNITSQVIVVTIPIICLAMIILFMNIVAPSSSDVRAMNYVIPISPRVTGEVTEVPIEPNRPIKKGDVLFKIDPVPFEAAVKAAEATLRGLGDQLKNAAAKKAALAPRIDLAKKRVEQFTALASTGAGSGPTSSRRKATSEILKAKSSPPTPRNRRPKRRSPRPKPTS